MGARACALSRQPPSAYSPWYEGSGRLKTSRIGCAMSRSMKTARRCAVATFPKSWPPYATPRLACSGRQAIRTLRLLAVGWLPSRYRRWRSSGSNWKTKWPCQACSTLLLFTVMLVDLEDRIKLKPGSPGKKSMSMELFSNIEHCNSLVIR